MIKVPLKEYIEKSEEFITKHENYLDIRDCIYNNSNMFSEDRLEELAKSLEEQYKKYSSIFQFEYCTDFNDEYLKTFSVANKDYWINILTHIGEHCIVENSNGIFKGMIATLDDFYYIIDVDGDERIETAVSHIKFN